MKRKKHQGSDKLCAVVRSSYAACKRAGLLRQGRPFRSSYAHPDAVKEVSRCACRGKFTHEPD